MNSLWYFEGVDLFRLLCPHKFAAYKENHSFYNYNKSDYIYFEEDAANNIYLIERGKVKIGYYTEAGEEMIKAILAKGDIFGEKAVLGEEKRREFAQSVDRETCVCPVSSNVIEDLLKNDKTFSIRFYKFLGYRFKKLERRLQLLLFKDTKTRLLEFLKELSDEYGHCCPETGNMIIVHPYTQKDIASLIGTSRPTLNNLLNELKEQNVIDFDRKRIRLKNIA